MPASASDDLLSKSRLLRQRIEARNNPPPPPAAPRKTASPHRDEMVVVIAEKPKRSPFPTLAYATVALIVFNLPYFLYQANAEPDPHNPFAGMGEALIMLICFVPLAIVSLVVWCSAVLHTIIQLVSRAGRRA